MPLKYVFWVLMLIWAIFGFAVHGGYIGTAAYGNVGGDLLLLALFGCLGWKVFGPAVQG
jgi:hypothetical protein